MKVLITSDWNTYAINGVATSIKNLMFGLRARGHEVKLLTLSSNYESRVTQDGWEVASLPASIVYPGARVRVGLMTKTYDKIIEWGPDIIHSQCELSTFVMAHHIAHECAVPIVHTYHTVYEDYTHYVTQGIKLPIKPKEQTAKHVVAEFSRAISSLCHGMIAPTEKVKSLLMRYECSCPLYVVPSGISTNKFRQKLAESDRIKLCERFDIKEGEIVAIYLGRIAEEKNIDELIDYIAKSAQNIKLLIVGGGPKLDEIKSYVEDKGLADRVKFSGMVEPQEVWKYYALADFFTSASTSETQGLTYIEALSSGLLLLCRKDDCLDGVIIPGENGYMFENESEYSAGLHKIIQKLRVSGYDRNETAKTADKFSIENFAFSVEEIYYNTLDEYASHRERSSKENIKALVNKVYDYTLENFKESKKIVMQSLGYKRD